ncbi:MAG: NTP transferase domain-containing protein [Bacteroidia bacterium]
MKRNCVVLILAGGHSSRMKFPKAYLEIGGEMFAGKIAHTYNELGFTRVGLVINVAFCSAEWMPYLKKLPADIHVIPDYFPEKGRIFSIQTGLAEEPIADFCFIHNVDNPFITGKVIKALWDSRSEESAVIPGFNGQGGHPVLIPAKIIDRIRTINEPENYTLKDILNQFPRTFVETGDNSILLNINTREDYNNLILTPNTLSIK